MGEESASLEFQTRPREAIETELNAIEEEIISMDEVLVPIEQEIDNLPENQLRSLQELTARLELEEIADDELNTMFPDTLMPLVQQIKIVAAKYRGLEAKRTLLEHELTSYAKEDLRQAIEDLSGRLDYDSVFDYYRNLGWGKGKSNTDLLTNTVVELYQLRRFQHELEVGGDKKDYYFYASGLRTLERYRQTWHEKGFLIEGPKKASNEPLISRKKDFIDGATDPASEQSITKKRQDLVRETRQIYDQIEKFSDLAIIYRHNLLPKSFTDHKLEDVIRVLDIENDFHRYQGFEGIEELDFDSEFIAAAERHLQKVFEEHRNLGHVMPDEEALLKEKQRINNLDVEKDLDEIKWEGFDAPDGSELVVTPEQIVNEVRDVLPPDFVHRLRVLRYRDRGEANAGGDDPNISLMGLFIPIYDEDHEMQAAEIEIYRDLIVPKDIGEIEKIKVRLEFMGTVWHEFGHNAHHMMRFDEMEAWEKVMQEDTTAVTWNVNSARKIGEVKEKKEDFSDSFKLFVSNPALLIVLSPIRFQFMKEFFERRLKTGQLASLNQRLNEQILTSLYAWEKLGHTPESIRKIYLSYDFGDDDESKSN